MPALQFFGKHLTVPVGTVEIEQNDEVIVFDLGKCSLPLFFHGEDSFFFPLDALVGLVFDFRDLYFGKSSEALDIFFFQHVKRFIFHFSYAENSDHIQYT